MWISDFVYSISPKIWITGILNYHEDNITYMWHVHWHETNLSGHGWRILTDEWFILIICPDLFKFQWTISHSCNHHLNGLLKDKRDLELLLQCIWEKPSIFISFSPRLSYSVQLLLPTPSVPEVLKFHRIGTVI